MGFRNCSFLHKRPNPAFPVRSYRMPHLHLQSDSPSASSPQSISFPCRIGLIAAIVGLAVASCGEKAEKPVEEEVVVQTVEKKVKGDANPFAMDVPGKLKGERANGLPYRTSWCGTGMPQYVDERVAREIIERVFKQAGFELTHDFAMRGDGLAFQADGYDPKTKIGYVFAKWSNLSRGLYSNWEWNDESRYPGDRLRRIAKIEMTDWPKEEQAEAQRILALQDEGQVHQALSKLFAKQDEKKLSLEEVEKLELLANTEKTFVAVISQYDSRFTYTGPRHSQKLIAEMRRVQD